ncbi:MAG: T9SS type A sorting domain-containing protein, partial [Bacteroidota bacterium]|nr:T9SS type A sorting domain-containing protein [Bacteroidota bacterium]
KAFCNYIRQLDPYKSPINIHTHPAQRTAIFTTLLGFNHLDGPSLQIVNPVDTHAETLNWIKQSKAKEHKWVVNLDEIGPSFLGVKPDGDDYAHDIIRKQALWGNLMAGGGGVEWYFGYRYPNSDLTAQDWRSRDRMWDLTRYALQFFHQYLPFWQMQNADTLTAASNDFCLALTGKLYAVYLPEGGTTSLNLGDSTGTYAVQWYNPREGGPLQAGTVRQIVGSGVQSIGLPPQNNSEDWVCLITNTGNIDHSIAAKTNTSSEEYFSIYPNPFLNQIKVQANKPVKFPFIITLRNLDGKPVFQTSIDNEKFSKFNLNTNSVKPGLYFLQINHGSHTIIRKLIKY